VVKTAAISFESISTAALTDGQTDGHVACAYRAIASIWERQNCLRPS